jgi:hypothetical protein
VSYLDAIVLARQIESDYPQYSITVVPLPDGYGVNVSWWRITYDKYCCVEYSTFVRMAEKHGFENDLEDTGLLIKPIEYSFLIKSKSQWALHTTLANAAREAA